MSKPTNTNENPKLKELSDEALSETVGGAIDLPKPLPLPLPIPIPIPLPSLPSLPACW